MVKTTSFLMFTGLVLTGCSSVTPSTILTQPTTSAAPAVDKSTSKNGSIYKKTTYKSLFENYRARVVGDVVTVIVNEQVSADKKNSASDTKQGYLDINAIGAGISNWQASEKGSVQNTGRATGSSSYNFTGAVAVNVIEVLENGNLVVTGEKQIGMDKGTEFIRVSGIVVPTLIDASNTISSNRLADARVEYRSSSNVDGSEIMKAINRFISAFLMI